jgi:hypothetical protein
VLLPVNFPSVADFCLNIPLYESYNKSREFDSEEEYCDHIFMYYECFSGQIDCFCIECDSYSVFISSNKTSEDSKNTFDQYIKTHDPTSRLFALTFHCARHEKHIVRFVFHFSNGNLTKIGINNRERRWGAEICD